MTNETPEKSVEESITNFVEVEKTIDEEINEIIDSLVADVHFEKTWPAHTAYYQIDLNQFTEKLRGALQAERQRREEVVEAHHQELQKARVKLLEEMAQEFDTNENEDYRAWQWANNKLQAIQSELDQANK